MTWSLFPNNDLNDFYIGCNDCDEVSIPIHNCWHSYWRLAEQGLASEEDDQAWTPRTWCMIKDLKPSIKPLSRENWIATHRPLVFWDHRERSIWVWVGTRWWLRELVRMKRWEGVLVQRSSKQRMQRWIGTRDGSRSWTVGAKAGRLKWEMFGFGW